MRFSLVFVASTVSASLLPARGHFNKGPNVPDASFPHFQTVTLDEAKKGKDREIQGLPDKNITSLTEATFSKTFHGVESVEHAVSKASTATAASCSANPNVRFEWRQYSDSDRLAFVKAIKCLMNAAPSGKFPPAQSRYEDFVRLHQNYMPNVHNNAKFTIWHRYYLWGFEQVLRAECGFNRAMPWWDETLDAGNFAQSTMFTNPLYFGSLPAPDANGNPVCITNGEFAGLTCNIGPGTATTPHCLSRGVTESNTAQCSSSYISYCLQRTDYSDWESCMEYGPHGYGHNGIGGVMSDVWGSPSDPIFWMHHSFVDHSYRIWQNQDVARIQGIDGVDAAGNTLTLNTMVYMGGISPLMPDVPISSLINTLGGVMIGNIPFCYRYTY